MKPKCRIVGNALQLRYNLPYEVQCSTVYPLTSPNGSTIILIGHAEGIFIVWRGGRPLKVPRLSVRAPKGPTPSNSDVMVVDLDDSDGDTRPSDTARPEKSSESLPPAEFEDEEEEIEPKAPYTPIVQTLNLPLGGGGGGGVTHISTPLLSDAAKTSLSPDLLKTHMLLGISCADSSIRVLTVPLAPPSEAAKTRAALIDKPQLANAGNGSWGETLTEIPRGLGHRTLIGAISVGVSARSLVVDAERENMDVDNEPEGGAASSADDWDILVASSSADAGGTLLIHRVPLGLDGQSLEDVEIWRRVLLQSPATAVDLHPGSTVRVPIYPRILVAEANGPVKVYECSDEESREDGRWIGELHAQELSSQDTIKSILSARFILGGFAAAALVDDGEWGVWDLSSLATQVRQHGFAYGGRINNPSKPARPGKETSETLNKPGQATNFAPMTPHTRKVRQNALFADEGQTRFKSTATPRTSPASTTAASGEISLSISSRDPSPLSEDGDAIIWYGDSVVYLSHLRSRHISSMTSSSSKQPSALTNLDDPFYGATASGVVPQARPIQAPEPGSLCSGHRVGAALLPNSRGNSGSGTSGSVKSRTPEIIVASEKALSIIGQPRSAEQMNWRKRNGLLAGAGADVRGQDRSLTTTAASALKEGAELAIDGIEGVLDGMARSAKRLSGRG